MNGVVGLETPRGALTPALQKRGGARVRLGQVTLDLGSVAEVLLGLERLSARGQGGCVLLPDVEQVVRAAHDEALREALATADLCLAGSPALVRAAGARDVPAGAQWVAPLERLARSRGWRVVVVAERPGVAEWAAGALRDHGLLAVGVSATGLPETGQGLAVERLLERIALTRPDLVLVSLDTPRQELFCQSAAAGLRPALVVGLGRAVEPLLEGRRGGRSSRSPLAWARGLWERWSLVRLLARTSA
jgi:N-acetylglucosaminyldiphosphoundecaprenol N-acetyl-beta-D-mannosaminyltransferase